MARRLLERAGKVVGDGRQGQRRRLLVEVLELRALVRLELPPLEGLGEQCFPVSKGVCGCVCVWSAGCGCAL